MLDEASAAVLTVEPYLLWLMLMAGCVSDLLLTTMFLALFHSSLLAALQWMPKKSVLLSLATTVSSMTRNVHPKPASKNKLINWQHR
jgi:hypothetical protein